LKPHSPRRPWPRQPGRPTTVIMNVQDLDGYRIASVVFSALDHAYELKELVYASWISAYPKSAHEIYKNGAHSGGRW
jgi:hypothetical protein